ncbi:hypothetical protein PF005_g7335 [Phytophthora fragariae]|uniref:Uncharacterized protein n=1 Tax=Phytophthora fragariae TaxID=53985 RepID=A0A6A3U9Q4_9STRA|nr:hypothetical protein PF003_g15218 [Phytophthora fragariae]KAE8941340.1 hypothetical protein PF009_g8875 [Phytophthora fragariae]KAE9016857.1 hypothetical protein PF011_g6965 [Phytophthora fragariae]KAE9120212.1 hypothetical protein PF007_g8262 [Phytophthora fragariae]KAE9121124.1 hypothetical protein PF010_g7228 [Phytophthora fragariae]
MDSCSVLLALCVASTKRTLHAAQMRALRRRLYEEICRDEWQRIVRVRHYVTLHCLKDPSRASWMDTWTRGTDENFIDTTSLSR